MSFLACNINNISVPSNDPHGWFLSELKAANADQEIVQKYCDIIKTHVPEMGKLKAERECLQLGAALAYVVAAVIFGISLFAPGGIPSAFLAYFFVVSIGLAVTPSIVFYSYAKDVRECEKQIQEKARVVAQFVEENYNTIYEHGGSISGPEFSFIQEQARAWHQIASGCLSSGTGI